MTLTPEYCSSHKLTELPGGLPLPSYTLIRIAPTSGRYRGAPTPTCQPAPSYAGTSNILTIEADSIFFSLSQRESAGQTKENFPQSIILRISKGCLAHESDIVFIFPNTATLEPNALYAAALAFYESQADILFFPFTVSGPDGDEVCMPLHPDGPACAARMRIIMAGGCFAGFPFPFMAIRSSAWLRAHESDPQDFMQMWDAFCAAGACVHTIGAPLIRMGQDFLGSYQETATVTSKIPRIAFVNDVGFSYGAGIAHRRLCDSVAMAGAKIEVCALGQWMSRDKCCKAEQNILEQLGTFSPDYIVCGNLHGSQCDNDLLSQMLGRWPVVFCMHDLWLLTGHCPHPGLETCEKAFTGCDESCPCPDSYPRIAPERIANSWRRNRQALSSQNLLPLANSAWTAAEYSRYAPHARPPYKIVLGCEDAIFSPSDTSEARRDLPLEPEDFVVFMPMCDFTSPFKGGKEGLEALDRLTLPGMKILCVGWQAEQAAALSDKVVAVPYADKPEEMARLFQASDVVVSFSHAETLGQTLIESAFCGVPSVAYAVTGLTDAVADGISGILCEENPDAVAAQVARLYFDKNLRNFLGKYAFLHARNTRSLFAAYKSLNDALEAPQKFCAHPSGFVRFRPSGAARDLPIFWGNTPAQSSRVFYSVKSAVKQKLPSPLWKLLRYFYHRTVRR